MFAPQSRLAFGALFRMMLLSVGGGVCVLIPSVSWGSIIPIDDFTNSSQSGFPTANNDLINQGQSTFLSASSSGYTAFTNGGFTSDVSKLNDGAVGSTNGNSSDLPSVAFDLDGTWETTFTLDLSVNTNGYDISSIRTISGWTDNRINQKYALSYSTAGAPGIFISLGTFTFTPPGSGSTTRSAQITLTDDTGTIATNVAALRFGFQTPSANDETVYREIDAVGVASAIPEPASLALLMGGAVSLLTSRRRRA